MISPQQIVSSLTIALIHLVVCGILAVIVIPVSLGYALFDSYQSPAWSMVAADHVLLFLEAPVAIMLYWIYHPTPRFEPPHYFVVDLLSSGPSFPVILALCALWSVAFGYLFACAIHWIRQLDF
jgi:hypothetical protein